MNEVTAVGNSSCHVDAVGKDETHSPYIAREEEGRAEKHKRE